MDNFLLIDFKDFKTTQICEFVMERLHSKVQEKVSYINNKILSNSINKEVYSSEFHSYYIDLADQIIRLINLEKHILFDYMRANGTSAAPCAIPQNSVLLIRQFQYEIKHTLLYVRVLFQELEKNASYQTITSIIEMELLNLEMIIMQWFQIVHKNILCRYNGQLN